MGRHISNSGEIAFADVSMAIFGPVLLLFVIYMIKAMVGGGDDHNLCKIGAPEAMPGLAQELSAWKHMEERQEKQDRERLERLCPRELKQQKLTKSDASPPPIALFCPSDQSRVAQSAGMEIGSLRDLAGQRLDTLKMLARCTADVTIPGPSEVQVYFKFGTSHPVQSKTDQRELTDEEFQVSMDGQAARIKTAIKNSPEYNRIEFIGHTDSTRVRTDRDCVCKVEDTQCQCFKDNYDLSYQRAKRVMLAVRSFLERDEKIKERLNSLGTDRLQLVAIGLADDEQKQRPPPDGVTESDTEKRDRDAKNRRIEIGYLKDERLQKETEQ